MTTETVANNDALVQAVDKVAASLNAFVEKYGQEAADLMMTVVQIKAANNSIVPFVVGSFLLFLGYKAFMYAYKNFRSSYSHYSDALELHEGGFIACALSGITGFIGSLLILESIELAAWIGLFEPKVYAAYLLLGKL